MKPPILRRPLAMVAALILFLVPGLLEAQTQTPEWIWHHNNGAPPASGEVRFFRIAFTAPEEHRGATLTVACDNEAEVFLNGSRVLVNREWGAPTIVNLRRNQIRTGENILAIRGANDDGPAGLLVVLDFDLGENRKHRLVSDASWVSSAKAEPEWATATAAATGWTRVATLGRVGVDPWGNVLANAADARSQQRAATPAESLYSVPGFKIELIHTAEPGQGSWVAITKDDKGRLIISPQYPRNNPEGGLVRVTLGTDGKVLKHELISRPLYDAQGMLFLDGAIYAVVNKYSASFESGFYRLRDNGNDQFDQIELLKKLAGNGEHGPHAVELGPDGMLYVLAGNHTKVPDDTSPDSPYRNFAEDLLLPRQWDGNGHAAGILAPGGYIARTDKDGRTWDLFCAGFRNPYDIAFNADGELFTFDADMEWDWGMPWYRPTRVNHCVSGGEYGWRSGTGKWPDYYPDSLGAIDIGLGSPTGVRFGTGARFPARYQGALYVMDWTYGRILAVHLKPDGASYTGSYENFICPAGLVDSNREKPPLNVTDLVIGDDGAMYFTVGGRGVQSGLYRVSYTGEEPTAPANLVNGAGSVDRKLRHRLESFQRGPDPKAVDYLWPHLNSEDRTIRYAARVALEAQPVREWQERALTETRPAAALTALLGLARVGSPELQPALLRAFTRFPLASLSEAQKLEKLRAIQLSFIRQGRPSSELGKLAIEKLSVHYPNPKERLNRELSQMLIYLEAPDVVTKSLKLMAGASTQEEQMHYLFHLRTAKSWTLDQRREYLAAFSQDRSGLGHPDDLLRWFKEAGRPYGNGASFANFLKNFRKEAVDSLTDSERAALEESLLASTPADGPRGRGVQAFPEPRKREFVREWKVSDITPVLDQVAEGRNFEKGRQAYVDAQCLACHRFGNEGGGAGPDLTAVATRFGHRDILESILEPSKVVSEQFLNTVVTLKDGAEVTGRVLDESDDRLVLLPNALEPEVKVEVAKSQIAGRTFSSLSPMPEGLVNILSSEEILDLVAFLQSAGRRNAPAFR